MAYELSSPDKVSTYNSMEAIIFRINDLWRRFNSLVLRGDLTGANWVLDRLWGELVSDANDDHRETFKELQEEYSKLNKIKEREQLYQFILKKEEFIRILQDAQGKGVKHQESALDYMDEGY